MGLTQYIVTGLAVGSLYSLLGLGLSLTQRSTNVLNFAQGEVSMLLAFICYFAFGWLGSNLALAFLATLAAATIVGLVLYNVVIYPNRNRDHESLAIITLGIKLAITGCVAWAFGADARVFPPVFAVDHYEVLGQVVGAGQAWTMLIGVAAMVVIALFLRYTSLGIAMRAASEDVNVAQLLGINLRVVGSMAWVIAAWLGAVTGILFATTVVLSPYMMGLAILKGFAALVIGGMGSISGVIIGGLLVGVAESMVAYAISPLLQESVGLALIIAVLLIRPQGLFASSSGWRA